MNQFDVIVFGKKTFSDILKDIHDNSKKTEKQITELIVSLKDIIDGPGTAQVVVPLIVQYLDVKVKNDEHLVKMAAIVQRAVNTATVNGTSDFILSDEETENLLKEANNLIDSQINLGKSPVLLNNNEQ